MDTTADTLLEKPQTPTPALSARDLPAQPDPRAAKHWLLASVAGVLVSALAVYQAPGVGSALAALVLVAAWVGIARVRERALLRGEKLALAGLVALGLVPVFRDSPWLHSYSAVLFLGIALSLPLLARAPARGLGIRVFLLEAFLAFSDALTRPAASARDELALDGLKGRLKTPLVGLALGLPAVAIFLGFFASADAVFANLVGRLLSFDGDGSLFVHGLVFLALTWVLVGLGARAASASRPQNPTARLLPLIGPAELLVGVLMVDALFLSFVAVQLVQIVGFTDALLEPGVTYAGSAREGFFQLLFVTGLVTLLVPVAHFATEGAEPGPARRVRVALSALLALTALVAGSALWRMSLYIEAYSLTELRFHASALMAWLILLLGWMHRSVLRGRGGFARGAGGSLVAAVLLVAALNPDARIAEVNLSRAEDHLDIGYFHELSADALPALAGGASALGPQLRGQLCLTHNELARQHAARHERWPLLSWSLPRASAAQVDCKVPPGSLD